MKIEFEWKETSVEPAMKKPVVYLTIHNHIGSFKHTMTCHGGDWKNPFSGWDHLVDKYKIKYWCYQEELIDGLE